MSGCLMMLGMISGSLLAADWDPNDDTFDPSIQSVVVGDASWIGDPSPFVHLGLPRTGYTYVNATHWDGFDPSVQLSLMVPLKAGETTPQAGGMLMMNKVQTIELIKLFETGLRADSKQEPIQIKTAMKDVNWSMAIATDEGQRFIQLQNKTNDKVDTYRFSINASKKLLGAIRHSLQKLESTTGK
ncbi:hypothetical protein Pla52o_15280 [Novipirellula galeiformis]|uniref:Uncharacterized protein n=1 Tax=Novipirellula galeiformis TaxID=2528004 RepID=A0A5C6CKV6_9BACT|nr:hypothetical protein [Novipirellula galeiformis]TWU25230.1 hypothetical protein Pla52o_15280 [Novipirellula galeiformis]